MRGVIDESSAVQDTSFGCAVTNRFDQLLDDEGDPFDVLRDVEVEKQKKKKKEKDEAKKINTGKQVKRETQKERKVALARESNADGQKRLPQGGPAQNEVRGEKRVVFQERRRQENEAQVDFSIERPQEQWDQGSRGRGGGRTGPRGRGGRGYPRSTDGFDQRGKREFERHSGSDRSGIKPEEKKGGSGQRNWGSVKDQIRASVDNPPSEETGDVDEVQETEVEPRVADGEVPEEAVAEMSLDEWKALQQQNRPKTELNLRKADTAVPSKAVVIHKSKHLEDLSNGICEEDEEGPFFRRPANDITSTLDINFGILARPARGGRGGRGRGLSGNRSGSAPPPPQEMARVLVPNPDDPEDFPALA